MLNNSRVLALPFTRLSVSNLVSVATSTKPAREKSSTNLTFIVNNIFFSTHYSFSLCINTQTNIIVQKCNFFCIFKLYQLPVEARSEQRRYTRPYKLNSPIRTEQLGPSQPRLALRDSAHLNCSKLQHVNVYSWIVLAIGIHSGYIFDPLLSDFLLSWMQ